MTRVLIFLCAFCCFATAFAAEVYPFHNPEKRAQFQALTQQLRCLVCQNENLAASNADLAADLRQQIYDRIQQGASNQQIMVYMRERYGDFVAFRPRWQQETFGLWLTPFILLCVGVVVFIAIIRRAKNAD